MRATSAWAWPLLLLTILYTLGAKASEPGFLGYSEVNAKIQQRVFDERFELGDYLGEAYSDSESSLLDLMGTHKTIGPRYGNHIYNAAPNAANSLLWMKALDGLAKDIGSSCGRTNRFRPAFARALRSICLWAKSTQAHADNPALLDYWLAWVSYDAPNEEFAAWRNEFSQTKYSSGSVSEKVRAMTLALLMNPYFLLRSK